MKIIFGDNQFLGVSHYRANKHIYGEIFNSSKDCKYFGRCFLMLDGADFAFSITKTVDALKIVGLSASVNLHPCLPYAHEIYNKIADDGIFKNCNFIYF